LHSTTLLYSLKGESFSELIELVLNPTLLIQHNKNIFKSVVVFQLGGNDLPFLPPKKGSLYLVPNGIRPVMQRTGIEVRNLSHISPLCKWNLSKILLSSSNVRFKSTI